MSKYTPSNPLAKYAYGGIGLGLNSAYQALRGAMGGNARFARKTYSRKRYGRKLKRRMRKRRLHPIPEQKVFYYRFNVASPPFKVTKSNAITALTYPANPGWYQNQLYFPFTPANGISKNAVLGVKCAVKSFDYKIAVAQGNVADLMGIPGDAQAQVDFNVRVVIGVVKDCIPTTASAFYLKDFFHFDNQAEPDFSNYGSDMFFWRKHPKANFKILKDHLFELDAGMKTDQISGSLDLKGMVVEFNDSATDTGDCDTTKRNCLFVMILHSRNSGTALNQHVMSRVQFRTNYYDN